MDSLRLRIALALVLLVAVTLAVDKIGHSLLIDVVLAVLVVPLAFLISRSLLQPLQVIASAAATIAGGDFAARVRPRPAGEIGALADAFNGMADNVQQQMASASQERSRLAATLNSSVDAVLAVDAELRVLYANVAAEHLFGRADADIVGNPFVWLLANQDVLAALQASRDQGTRQVCVIERPGRMYLQAVTTPITGGGDWAVLAAFHDLTDVKRTELVRRDFVANVSHELRTPVAGIKAVTETLLAGALEDPQVAGDFLRQADAEVDRLTQLIEELLELSRIESGEVPLSRAPTDVAALLSDVVERMRPQAARKHQALSLEVDGGVGQAELDAARLERAIVNLIHNAIKFTPEDGSVTVRAHREEGRLQIEVSDSGIGIAASELPRLFERFYKVDQSRANAGSGLGLALVKHAVETHGGSVSVESELGRGSTFRLSLPAGS